MIASSAALTETNAYVTHLNMIKATWHYAMDVIKMNASVTHLNMIRMTWHYAMAAMNMRVSVEIMIKIMLHTLVN
jgi:hypothetical protein